MPSPILARADALMHRKRQSDTDFDDVPVLTDAIDDDDDIPPLAARPLDSELREQLAGELARRIEQRITAELPRLIDSALRDFLAEQEMIAASTLRD